LYSLSTQTLYKQQDPYPTSRRFLIPIWINECHLKVKFFSWSSQGFESFRTDSFRTWQSHPQVQVATPRHKALPSVLVGTRSQLPPPGPRLDTQESSTPTLWHSCCPCDWPPPMQSHNAYTRRCERMQFLHLAMSLMWGLIGKA